MEKTHGCCFFPWRHRSRVKVYQEPAASSVDRPDEVSIRVSRINDSSLAVPSLPGSTESIAPLPSINLRRVSSEEPFIVWQAPETISSSTGSVDSVGDPILGVPSTKIGIHRVLTSINDLVAEEELIGTGTTSRVTIGKLPNGDKIAIKRIPIERLANPKCFSHLLNEISVLLNEEVRKSPYLMKLYKVEINSKEILLVTKASSIGDLYFYIKAIRLKTEEQITLICAEILNALETLHQEGFIYRDLKPENVLICEEGHVSLIDYGLAKRGTSLPRVDSFVGTPEYLAPEIVTRSEPQAKCASDLWSFGILLYELLSGLSPFYDENPEKIYIKIIDYVSKKSRLPLPIGIPDTAKDLISRLLTTDPDKRLSIAEIKAHPFFASINWEILKEKAFPVFTKKELERIQLRREKETFEASVPLRPLTPKERQEIFNELKRFFGTIPNSQFRE